MDRHQENRVLFVEFDRHGPFEVVARRRHHGSHRGDPIGREYDVTEIYAVEWCRRDQRHYVEMVGSGNFMPCPGRSYWAAPGQGVLEQNGARRLKRLRRGWRDTRLLELCLDREDTRCYYCEVCDDWLPELAPCEHVERCATCGYPVLPDEGEHYECREEDKATATVSAETAGA